MRLLPVSLAAMSCCASAVAQQVVDYDSSALASPPGFGYPLYTPGAGSLGQTVRTQWRCPDTFLAQQSVSAGFVTHIGLALAGTATYDTFELRAGVSTVPALTGIWDTNLPDQRLQKNLANVPLVGGGTASAPVNQWVEFELDHPFHWQPGQNIVVDLIAHLAAPGVMCGTTVGTGVERAFHANYQGQPTAPSVQATGGLVFRMRFAPLAIVPFGQGCPGTGSFVPVLASTGQSALGSSNYTLAVTQALPGAIAGFALGFSRQAFSGGPLPFPFGGGCDLLVSPDVFVVAIPSGTGPGTGTASMPLLVPNRPSLRSSVVYAQFAQIDLLSPANAPVVFSNAGAVVVF